MTSHTCTKSNTWTWRKHRVELKLPLLIIETKKGMLACGYLSVETFNKTEEACAIVSGVSNYEDMYIAKVHTISKEAEKLGVKCGMTGCQALQLMGGSSS